MSTWQIIAKWLAGCILAGTLSGCASPGQFALVDVDLRSPEQIAADKEEDVQTFKSPAPPWYQFAIDLVSVINGRVRIFAVEWEGKDE